MAFLEFELLDAKLGQGFPHVCFSIPTEHLPAHGVLVCRYNIARNHGTFSESSEHGFRREPFMIPVGVSAGEATSILRAVRRGSGALEVLAPDFVPIPPGTRIDCYSEAEANAVDKFVARAAPGVRVLPVARSSYKPSVPNAALDYVLKCASGGEVLSPPMLEFD
jgi:hypothetical protein